MGKPTGFMEYDREPARKRPVDERVKDFREVEQPISFDEIRQQAARCMDCGIPFCHGVGCPVQNLIPDFNDMVYRGKWHKALDLLHSRNNFPEVTGRICPALCEASCTLGINQPAVTIRQIELLIVEHGWQEGWIQPEPPAVKTGKRVAVVGSGPAGMAAAQELARAGQDVVLYEKDSRIGGILRYGIPDFKLDKTILDRRMAQMEGEGVTFETDVNVGEDISIKYLQKTFDAVLLTGGARVPRDLPIEGRDLHGIYFAMEFLMQQNHRVAGDEIDEDEILATDKNVVIIGGGDTGADCVGTSNRHGAKSITQLEIMPKPPEERAETTPWPQWPYMLRTSSSHQEGCERMWNVLTKRFEGDGDGNVKRIYCVKVEWKTDDETGRKFPDEVPGSEFSLDADLVLLAMGFTNEGNAQILNAFDVETDQRGQAVLDDKRMSSQPGVFIAGDISKGASLVVRAIQDGRNAAEGISQYLAEKDAEG